MTRGPATALAVLAIVANTAVDIVGVGRPPAWWMPVVIGGAALTICAMFWSVTRPWAD